MSPLDLARDALTDAAQFIDAVRQDAISEGWWTEWDQQMRDKIGAALKAYYEREDALVGVVKAWDILKPGSYDKDIWETWLLQKMKPAIDAARRVR